MSNRHYHNFVLDADYSDLDVIRVDEGFVYGLLRVLLYGHVHTLFKRLVTWSIIGQIYNRLDID